MFPVRVMWHVEEVCVMFWSELYLDQTWSRTDRTDAVKTFKERSHERGSVHATCCAHVAVDSSWSSLTRLRWSGWPQIRLILSGGVWSVMRWRAASGVHLKSETIESFIKSLCWTWCGPEPILIWFWWTSACHNTSEAPFTQDTDWC